MNKLFSALIVVCTFHTLALFAQETLDATFAKPAGLTDEQTKEAKEFIHQGRKDALIKSGCEKSKDSKNCSENVDDAGSVLGGQFGQLLENNLGKFYGMLFGASSFLSGGGGPTLTVMEKSKDPKAQIKAKDYKDYKAKAKVDDKDPASQKSDYCLYAAMGYEMVAGFTQQAFQDKIEKDLKDVTDIQMRSLLALRGTHDARRKTATIQGTIYSATSACYITRALASKGRVVMDFKYYAKMSASAALGALYLTKAAKHKKAVVAVDAVITSIKDNASAGKCNPYTETACFCGEPTSKTGYAELYEEICVQNKGNANPSKVSMGCGVLTNGVMTYDKECQCKQTNTCFKATLAQNLKFNFGSNLINDANQGFELLSSGQFDSGKFDSLALQTGAHASKFKGKIATTGKIPTPNLSAEEKKLAEALGDVLPPSVAALVADANSGLPASSPAAMDSIADVNAGLPKELKAKIEATEDPRYTNSGSGFGEAVATEEGFSLPSPEGEQANNNSTEILSFAEQAVSRADVTKAPEKPIFEIISDRYKRSAIHLNH